MTGRLLMALRFLFVCSHSEAGELRGVVVDSVDETRLADRLCIQRGSAKWFLAEEADPVGSAVSYSSRLPIAPRTGETISIRSTSSSLSMRRPGSPCAATS